MKEYWTVKDRGTDEYIRTGGVGWSDKKARAKWSVRRYAYEAAGQISTARCAVVVRVTVKPKRPKPEAWMNVYAGGESFVYGLKQVADACANNHGKRKECIPLFRVRRWETP